MRVLISLLAVGSAPIFASGCGSSAVSDDPGGSGNSSNGTGGISDGSGGASSGGAATGGASTGGSGGAGTGDDAGTGGVSAAVWPDWVVSCRDHGTGCPTSFDPVTHYPAAFCAYATEDELEAYEEQGIEDCPFYDMATPEQIDDAQEYYGCHGTASQSVLGCYPCSSRAAGSYLCSL